MPPPTSNGEYEKFMSTLPQQPSDIGNTLDNYEFYFRMKVPSKLTTPPAEWTWPADCERSYAIERAVNLDWFYITFKNTSTKLLKLKRREWEAVLTPEQLARERKLQADVSDAFDYMRSMNGLGGGMPGDARSRRWEREIHLQNSFYTAGPDGRTEKASEQAYSDDSDSSYESM